MCIESGRGSAGQGEEVLLEGVETHKGGADAAVSVGSCVYAPDAMRSLTLSARLRLAVASRIGADLCDWLSCGQGPSAMDPGNLLQVGTR